MADYNLLPSWVGMYHSGRSDLSSIKPRDLVVKQSMIGWLNALKQRLDTGTYTDADLDTADLICMEYDRLKARRRGGVPGYPGKRVQVRKSPHTGLWLYRCPCGRSAGGYYQQSTAFGMAEMHLRLSHGVGSVRP